LQWIGAYNYIDAIERRILMKDNYMYPMYHAMDNNDDRPMVGGMPMTGCPMMNPMMGQMMSPMMSGMPMMGQMTCPMMGQMMSPMMAGCPMMNPMMMGMPMMGQMPMVGGYPMVAPDYTSEEKR
jgi:hypothetical protein